MSSLDNLPGFAQELNAIQPAMLTGHVPWHSPYWDPCRDGHGGTTQQGEWAVCSRCGRPLYKIERPRRGWSA